MQGCIGRFSRGSLPSKCWWLVVATIPLISSCQGAPKASDLSSAISRYEEGKYERALTDSEAAMREAGPLATDKAEVLAAMSSYRLGRLDRAQAFARAAADSTDPQLRAQGLVILGDVMLARGSASEAAKEFDAAAEAFSRAKSPDDAASATRYAERARAVALARTPSPAAVAQPTQTPPSKSVPRSEVAARASPQPSGKSFTVRAGSYTTLAAAQKRATALTTDLARSHAPEAHIDEISTAKGEKLFAVRIGAWPTRVEAEKVMASIGRKDLMVGATVPGK
ncbi:MAG: SPOR domain-containing protein [Phycisphaerales bacterium]|nr:SPOR domain-containing protein [Phycisphaerales bacterium]